MARPAAPIEELSAERIAQLLAAAQRRRPQLTDLLWHEDEAVYDGLPVLRRAVPEAASARDPSNYDPVRRRIRDRYISVRFAGVARGSGDLENPARVMKAARLAFDEGETETALELLALAIDQNAGEPQLRLAELEIAYLARSRVRFVTAASEFHELFPRSVEWPEVVRLGRQLAPNEPLFTRASLPSSETAAAGEAPHWIESPWDAARGLEAAQFHSAMLQEGSLAH